MYHHNIIFSLHGYKRLYQTSCSVMAFPVLSRAAFGILQRPLVLLNSEHVKVVGLPERRFINHIGSGSSEGRGSKHHLLAEVPKTIIANAPIKISHFVTTRWRQCGKHHYTTIHAIITFSTKTITLITKSAKANCETKGTQG